MTQQKFRILIVEDEFLIAEELVQLVRDLGYEPVGPAVDAAAALLMAKTEVFDAAILDMRLGSERAEAVAELLAERHVPFAFSVADVLDVDPHRWTNVPVVSKPYGSAQLVHLLGQLLAQPLSLKRSRKKLNRQEPIAGM